MSDKPWFQEASSETGKAFLHFNRDVTSKSALDEKTAELIKLATSSVLRCQHCTELHIRKALEVGASRQEVADALLIAALQGAGTQLYWNKEGFGELLGDEA